MIYVEKERRKTSWFVGFCPQSFKTHFNPALSLLFLPVPQNYFFTPIPSKTYTF
jgi:hypothetical protein